MNQPSSDYSMGVPEHELRTMDLPETSYVCGIPLYPVGHTVWLYGSPGVGKSFIQQGMNHTIAWGKPLGTTDRLFAPDITANVLYVDLEGTDSLTAERSLALTPKGALPTDDGTGDMPTTTTYLFSEHITGRTFPERMSELETRLLHQENSGIPYSLVILDTYTAFVGGNPGTKNAYDHDVPTIQALNALAAKYDVCIVFIHHPNKAGEMSGSTGRAGTSSMVMCFEKTGEGQAVLRMEKNRVGPELEFYFEWDRARIWRLATDMPVKLAVAKGNNKTLLALLNKYGIMTKGELMAETGLPGGSIDSALNRMAKKGLVIRGEEGWQACFAPTQDMPLMPVHQPMRWDRCLGCNCVLLDGTCPNLECRQFQQGPEPAAAPAGTGGAGEQDVRRHRRSVLPDLALDTSGMVPEDPKKGAIKASMALMKASVQRNTARYRPSLFAAQPDIPQAEIWEGRNKWTAGDIAPGTAVVRLDKNGAYLSAANTALPVGPLKEDPDPAAAAADKRAGYHLIEVPGRELPCGGPFHTRTDRATAWITTPTLRQLKAAVPGLQILRSFTAPSTEVLMRPWIDALKTQRAKAIREDDQVLYAFVKNCYSLVISTMGDSAANFELRRPDWMHIIRAQAYANLWTKSLQALAAGVEVVKVGNTDEIWVVDDDRWRGATYFAGGQDRLVFPLGTDLGEWKEKERRTVGEPG